MKTKYQLDMVALVQGKGDGVSCREQQQVIKRMDAKVYKEVEQTGLGFGWTYTGKERKDPQITPSGLTWVPGDCPTIL